MYPIKLLTEQRCIGQDGKRQAGPHYYNCKKDPPLASAIDRAHRRGWRGHITWRVLAARTAAQVLLTLARLQRHWMPGRQSLGIWCLLATSSAETSASKERGALRATITRLMTNPQRSEHHLNFMLTFMSDPDHAPILKP
jgi:hypothetical protein